MKAIKFFSFCFSVFFCSSLSAQLKVDSIGAVQIGSTTFGGEGITQLGGNEVTPPPEEEDESGYDCYVVPANSVNLQLRGYVPKISFGEYNGSQFGATISKLGPSNLLKLYGADGIVLSSGASGYRFASYQRSGSSGYFNFWCNVYANGILLTSDERLKKDIRPLTGSLLSLQKLTGIRYLFNAPIVSSKGKFVENADSISDDLRFGFSAQALQKVFPNLVKEDTLGLLRIDYIGLIPVVVESIKEQQQLLDAQSAKIKELEAAVAKLTNGVKLRAESESTGTTDIDNLPTTNFINAYLYQNAPNPFTDQTEINYFIPAEIQQAYICIFDMQGKMLKKLDAQTGTHSITVRGSELQAGIYLYSLIVDGQEIDTKRMILTK